MKNIYRGIWADRLENGDELPVGGFIFSDKLTTKLQLDFDAFDDQLDNYRSPKEISRHYAQHKQEIIDWLSQGGSKIDPYLFFIAYTVQMKVQQLMAVKPGNLESNLKRSARFKDDKAKLTGFVGVAMCGEQASLGQYLLQNVLEDYSTSYMSGVEAQSPSAELGNHSFIVVRNPDNKTYIFDIARPRSGNNLPRVLETDILFNYDLFKETENLLVGATEILQGGRLFFGVGNPMLEQELNIIDLKTV